MTKVDEEMYTNTTERETNTMRTSILAFLAANFIANYSSAALVENACNPVINVQGAACCNAQPQKQTCPKVATKVVTKVEEKVVTVVEKQRVNKNRASLLVGVGPKGNLDHKLIENGHLFQTDRETVFGLQLQRTFWQGKRYDAHGLVQGLTNETYLLGLGVGF